MRVWGVEPHMLEIVGKSDTLSIDLDVLKIDRKL